MNNVKKIVVCGNYGAGNYGDEAILDGILKILKKAQPQARVWVMSSRPDLTRELHQVNCISFVPSGFRSVLKRFFSGEFVKTKHAIKDCDLFILGGGGLLNDDHPSAIWIWFVQTYFALKYKKKIACLGQSVGPLKRGWTKWLAKKIFSKAAVITIRDEKSLDLLKSIGITHGVKLADLVFALDQKAKKTCEKPYIVVSLRPWNNLNDSFAAEFVVFLDWIVGTQKISLKLLPFQKEPDDDEAFLMKIKSQARHGDLMEILPYDGDYKQALAVIAGARAVVGMRLHSLIFAALEDVPFLGISYSEKVKSIAEILGMESFVVNPSDAIKVADYQKVYELLFSEYDQIKNRLQKAVTHEQKQVLEHVEILRNIA